jgi:hypothetical protein
MHLLRTASIRQCIQRIRTAKVDYGPNPENLNKIAIPPGLCLTYGSTESDGANVLLIDAGVYDDSKRILAFATEANLNLLKCNSTWYGDGTFAVCPDIFYQLYAINIISKGKNLPMIYALLPDKEETSFTKFFV